MKLFLLSAFLSILLFDKISIDGAAMRNMNTFKTLVEAFANAAEELGVPYDGTQGAKSKEQISRGWTVELKSLFEIHHRDTLPKNAIRALEQLVDSYLKIYENTPKNEIVVPIRNSAPYIQLQNFCRSTDLTNIESLTRELQQIAVDPEKTYTSTGIIQYDGNKIGLNRIKIEEVRSHVPTMKAEHAIHQNKINEKMENLDEFNSKYNAAFNKFKELTGENITPAMRTEFETHLQAFLDYVRGWNGQTTYIEKLKAAIVHWKAYHEECKKWGNVLYGTPAAQTASGQGQTPENKKPSALSWGALKRLIS